MLKAQGLARRGILPGDMVWIYTGWSENWKDADDAGSPYYAMAPGLAVDAAKLLATKRIVAIGLDAPFIDAGAERHAAGQGAAAPAAPSPACRSRSTTTCCRCSASTISRT